MNNSFKGPSADTLHVLNMYTQAEKITVLRIISGHAERLSLESYLGGEEGPAVA